WLLSVCAGGVEAEAARAGVLLAHALERLLCLPALEDLPLERGMVGHARKWLEHASDRSYREQCLPVARFSHPEPEVERTQWQTTSRPTTSTAKSSRATRRCSSTSGPSGVARATRSRRCSTRSPTSGATSRS